MPNSCITFTTTTISQTLLHLPPPTFAPPSSTHTTKLEVPALRAQLNNFAMNK